MNFIKKLFSDKKMLSQGISLLVSFVALVVVVIAMLPGTRAWLARNDDVSSNGMSLTAKSEWMRFADTFTAKAVINDIEVASGIHKRDADDMYYLWNGSDFELDAQGNKQTLSYKSLYPGEYIEITLKFTCSQDRIGKGYTLYFDGLDNSDTFTTVATSTSSSATYSILGVYKLFVQQSDGSFEDKGFLYDFSSSTEGQPTTVDIASGVFDQSSMDSDGYVTLTLRLQVDLEQYNGLPGTYANLLSEKTAKIQAIVIAPKEV